MVKKVNKVNKVNKEKEDTLFVRAVKYEYKIFKCR